MAAKKKKAKKKVARKVDRLAQSKGSTASKLRTRRQSQAARLEEITGIKQPKRGKNPS